MNLNRNVRQLVPFVWILVIYIVFHGTVNAQTKNSFETDSVWFNGDRPSSIALARDQIGIIGSTLRNPGSVSTLVNLIPGSQVIDSTNNILRLRLPENIDANSLFENADLATRLEDANFAAVYYTGAGPEAEVLTLSGEIVVMLEDNADLASVDTYAKSLGSSRLREGPVKGTYIFECIPSPDCLDVANSIYNFTDVVYAYPNWYRLLSKRIILNDPLYSFQWHLENTGQQSGTPGEDANVQQAWDLGVSGAENTPVTIAVVDDGVEVLHEDLITNTDGLSPTASHIDLVDNDSNPTPPAGVGLAHGTAVAGVSAATGNNSTGVVGVAYGAKLNGIRLLGGFTTVSTEATALTHNLTHPTQPNDIYNNSWGPSDNGSLDPLSPIVEVALTQGVTVGRNGLGTNYVWAGGNGLSASDNSNYDGYANSRHTISVAASNNTGTQSFYSEPGANLLVNAPSSGFNAGTTTSDLSGNDGYNSPPAGGNNNYTSTFGGTSSAAPLVAGVVGLLLDANAQLGWRDVQRILALSADQNDTNDNDWTQNGAGHWINHKYGFGRVDAGAAVSLASNWVNLSSEINATESIIPGVAVPDGPNGSPIQIDVPFNTDISDIESVLLTVDSNHTYWGDLRIEMISPAGTSSILTETHNSAGSQLAGGFTFSSVRHLGESSLGVWSIIVQDGVAADVGLIDSLTLQIFGSAGQTLECFSKAVTVNLANGDQPTTGDDVILGTAGPDIILALAGDDTICSLDGNDIIMAGGGNDTVDASMGDDEIFGGGGVDLLYGGDGADLIDGGGADDEIYGENGDDTLLGRTGVDAIDGGAGVDSISGGPSGDFIFTGDGATVNSGVFISGGAGSDVITGGNDADDIRASSGADEVYGGGGDDIITGGIGRDEIWGGSGDDIIKGQDSQDTLYGESGNDTINGGAGNDSLDGGSDNDVCNGQAGSDSVSGGCETTTGVP